MTEHDHAANVAARYMYGLRVSAAGITLVILYGLEMPKLLANWGHYRSTAVQVAAVVVFTAIALVAWRDKVVRRLRWPLIVVVLAASIAATATLDPVQRLGTA